MSEEPLLKLEGLGTLARNATMDDMQESTYIAIKNAVKMLKSYIPVKIPTTLKCTCLNSTKDENLIFFGTKQGKIGVIERESEEVINLETISKFGFTCMELDMLDEFIYVSGPEKDIRKLNRELEEVLCLQGHTDQVNFLVVSRDNKYLYSASNDGSARAWPVQGGEAIVLFTSEVHQLCLDITSDNKHLAVGGSNGITIGLVLYESDSFFREVKKIDSQNEVTAITFSEKNFFLVAGDSTGLIFVYNFETWNQIRKFNHNSQINGINVSSAENLIVTCGNDAIVKMWDMKGKREETNLRLHLGPVRDCVITKDQRSVISGGTDGFVIIWRIPNFETEIKYRIKNFEPLQCWFSSTHSRLEGIGLDESGCAVVWWDDLGNKYNLFQAVKPRKPKEILKVSNEIVLFYQFEEGTDEKIGSKGNDDIENYICVDVYSFTDNCKVRSHLIQSYCEMAYIGPEKKYCFTGESFRVNVWNYSDFELVKSIPGIVGRIKEVLYVAEYSSVLIYDDSGTLSLYDFKEIQSEKGLEINEEQVDTLQFSLENKQICKLGITANKLYLLIAFDMHFKVIDLRSFQEIKSYNSSYLGLHVSAKNTILAYTGSEIAVYSADDFELLAYYRKKFVIEKLILSTNHEEFLILFKNTVLRLPNPIMSKTLRLVADKTEEMNIVQHIYQVIIKKCNTPYTVSPFLIEPMHINVLHIYAQKNKGELLRQGIIARIPYLSSIDGITPISISIRNNYKDCIKLAVKGLTTGLDPVAFKTDALTYRKLENDLVDLNDYGFYNMHKLYDQLFIEDTEEANPNLCDVNLPLPIITYSENPFIDCRELGISRDPPEWTNAITYKKSLVRFNMTLGSNESLAFLKSIKNCPNSEIFRTPLIQIILDEKWTKARRLMLCQACLYLAYLVSLMLYLADFTWFIYLTFILNFPLYAYESIFIYIDPRNYFTSFWNLVDTARALLVVFFFVFANKEDPMKGWLAILVLISWIRGITYFRINYKTRYLIGLLFEVIKSIIPFMVIFFYTTLGYSVIEGMLFRTQDQAFMNFMSSYMISNGSWDNFRFEEDKDRAGDYVYPIGILIITLINPVIIVNLLVAILSDTYERVQEESIVADGIELADMIIEIETLFFWNRQNQDKHYIHTAEINLIQEEDIDEMELNDMVRKVKEKIEYITLEVDEKVKSFTSLLTFNKDLSEKTMNLLKKIAGVDS